MCPDSGTLAQLRGVKSPTRIHEDPIPKAIQKRLPPPVRNHPDVVGRQGNPNIRNIPKPAHDRVHTSAPGPYHPGGNYNRRFDQLIQERGGYGAVSPRDIVEIRDQLVREFKL